MPELPEIETVRRVTGPLMTGRTVESVEITREKVVSDPGDFPGLVTGRTITEVGRRAKALLVHLDDGSHLVIRFGMTGALLCVPASDPVHKHARVSITFTDGTRAEFRDMRMFGHIWLIPADTEDSVSGVAELGIEPDDPAMDWRFLRDHMGSSKRAVKSALLDQSIVCGLGNIYSDEVLWRAKVCPENLCCDLRPKDWKAVAEHIPEVIAEAIEGNAVTADEFRKDGGVRYRFRQLDAYGNAGKPCGRCGTAMVRSVIGQRSSVWCPRCQKKH